jgi:hypothetical protein
MKSEWGQMWTSISPFRVSVPPWSSHGILLSGKNRDSLLLAGERPPCNMLPPRDDTPWHHESLLLLSECLYLLLPWSPSSQTSFPKIPFVLISLDFCHNHHHHLLVWFNLADRTQTSFPKIPFVLISLDFYHHHHHLLVWFNLADRTLLVGYNFHLLYLHQPFLAAI